MLELIVSCVLETRHCLVLKTPASKSILDNATWAATATQEPVIIISSFDFLDDHLNNM